MEYEVIEQFLNEEDDDSDSYFLQPAICPYNMTEKIAAANQLLNNNEYDLHERNVKVKFRENLVDYEPDYTSDEATEGSVYEKQNEADDNTIYDNEATDLDVQLQNKLNLDIVNSDDDEILEEIFDDDSGFLQTQPELLISEQEECYEEEITEENTDTLEETANIDEYIETEISASERKKENHDPNNATDRKSPKKSKGKSKSERKTLKLKETNIICKTQCAEKLNDYVKYKMQEQSASPKHVGPVLKLKKRQCCDTNLKPKLPIYTGLRSEYGLSPEQLEKREKLKVLTQKRCVVKKQKQHELHQERVQHNEKMFCEWLKDIAKRKEMEQKKIRKTVSPYTSPKLKTSPYSKKERPKTANEIYNKYYNYDSYINHNNNGPSNNKKKRRPHTSTACVFIEVPQKCLQKGIQIGDLLVTKNSNSVKKLHMLAAA